MKKLLLLIAVMLLAMTGCAKKEEEATPSGDTVLIQVTTEGLGRIAVADGEETPEYDPEFPAQSSYMNITPGSKVTMLAVEDDPQYKFTKWTKDGADYSTDMQITVTVDADVAYVAVFNVSNGYDGPAVENVEDAKTLADVLALPNLGTTSTSDKLVYAFELNGTVYRAVCNLTQELSDAIFNLDFSDPDYQKKYNELVAPIEIDHIENVTANEPKQEDLDKYVGKTGADLTNEGWISSGYNLEDQEFYMNYGLFAYAVKFNEKVEKPGDAETEDIIKDLTIASIRYDGLGDVANPDVTVE